MIEAYKSKADELQEKIDALTARVDEQDRQIAELSGILIAASYGGGEAESAKPKRGRRGKGESAEL